MRVSSDYARCAAPHQQADFSSKGSTLAFLLLDDAEAEGISR